MRKISQQSDTLEQSALRGVAALQKIVDERDQLLQDQDRMSTDLAVMNERCKQLEARLQTATTERDHYMRYSTELTVKLNDIQIMIEGAVRGAKHAAFKPSNVIAPPPVSMNDLDSGKLEHLIKRLPVNGGGEKTDA